jgi:hypothetical protein
MKSDCLPVPPIKVVFESKSRSGVQKELNLQKCTNNKSERQYFDSIKTINMTNLNATLSEMILNLPRYGIGEPDQNPDPVLLIDLVFWSGSGAALK